MLYNKNQVRQVNDKKILHKVGKQWKVVSVAFLLALGGGAIASNQKNVSADANNYTPTVTAVTPDYYSATSSATTLASNQASSASSNVTPPSVNSNNASLIQSLEKTPSLNESQASTSSASNNNTSANNNSQTSTNSASSSSNISYMSDDAGSAAKNHNSAVSNEDVYNTQSDLVSGYVKNVKKQFPNQYKQLTNNYKNDKKIYKNDDSLANSYSDMQNQSDYNSLVSSEASVHGMLPSAYAYSVEVDYMHYANDLQSGSTFKSELNQANSYAQLINDINSNPQTSLSYYNKMQSADSKTNSLENELQNAQSTSSSINSVLSDSAMFENYATLSANAMEALTNSSVDTSFANSMAYQLGFTNASNVNGDIQSLASSEASSIANNPDIDDATDEIITPNAFSSASSVSNAPVVALMNNSNSPVPLDSVAQEELSQAVADTSNLNAFYDTSSIDISSLVSEASSASYNVKSLESTYNSVAILDKRDDILGNHPTDVNIFGFSYQSSTSVLTSTAASLLNSDDSSLQSNYYDSLEDLDSSATSVYNSSIAVAESTAMSKAGLKYNPSDTDYDDSAYDNIVASSMDTEESASMSSIGLSYNASGNYLSNASAYSGVISNEIRSDKSADKPFPARVYNQDGSYEYALNPDGTASYSSSIDSENNSKNPVGSTTSSSDNVPMRDQDGNVITPSAADTTLAFAPSGNDNRLTMEETSAIGSLYDSYTNEINSVNNSIIDQNGGVATYYGDNLMDSNDSNATDYVQASSAIAPFAYNNDSASIQSLANSANDSYDTESDEQSSYADATNANLVLANYFANSYSDDASSEQNVVNSDKSKLNDFYTNSNPNYNKAYATMKSAETNEVNDAGLAQAYGRHVFNYAPKEITVIKDLMLHTSPTYTKKNHTAGIPRGTHLSVIGIGLTNNGILRYLVNYKGGEGYVTAKNDYVRPHYLFARNNQTVTVQVIHDLDVHTKSDFRKGKVTKHLKPGTTVMGQILAMPDKAFNNKDVYGGFTRIKLPDGKYITADTKYVTLNIDNSTAKGKKHGKKSKKGNKKDFHTGIVNFDDSTIA